MKLSKLGEDRLLAQLLPKLPGSASVVLGAGDDSAVVEFPCASKLQLLKTDCVVEGIHFPTKSRPLAVGWKAMARPLSDFAAMSGVPQFALVTMILPSDTTLNWIKQVYRGLEKAARAFEVAIVGGDTSKINGPAVISVDLTGFVEKDRWVARSGGRANDELFVTGRFGGSLRSGRHLRFTPRIKESRWLTEHFSIHAMMDLSDGLGADLPRLARASDVGFELEEDALPRQRGCSIAQAISDGEDYELLFAISPRQSARLQRSWRKKFPNLPLTRIGRLLPHSTFRNPHFPPGYAHFK
jgi:thiamine-monophosphate kinase